MFRIQARGQSVCQQLFWIGLEKLNLSNELIS